jgi:hypothetical protein
MLLPRCLDHKGTLSVPLEREAPDDGLAITRTVSHRDHRPVETNHDGGDGALKRRHLVLPVLFLGRGDAAHPSRPRAVSLIAPTRIGLPSASKRFNASSVAEHPTALLVS